MDEDGELRTGWAVVGFGWRRRLVKLPVAADPLGAYLRRQLAADKAELAEQIAIAKARERLGTKEAGD